MNNIKKQGEEELKRALLMMKYDNRKTLTENVEGVMGLNEQPDSKMPFQPEKFGYVQGKPETVQPSIQKQQEFFGGKNSEKQETLANTDTQTTENNPKTNINTTTKNVNMWDYVDSKSPEINVNLGVTESEIENFKSKGWSEVQLDEINRDVSDDEGLVDSLDATTMGYLGDNMEDDDMLLASSIIGKYKLSYVRWNDKYYPAMEAVRAKYSEDESGDSLRADIWDPPGTNTSDVQKFSKDTATIYDNSYKNWCDILNSLVAKTDTEGNTEGNVDDEGTPTPPPTPTPKPKYNPYRDIKTRKIYDDSQIER